MNLLFAIIILAAGYIFWILWGFIKYKSKESIDKKEVYSYLRDGLSLKQSLQKAFFNLNKTHNLGLQNSTINRVSTKIAKLVNIMNIDNVIEIYSTFVHRYIFENGSVKKPTNISDQKIIYAVETLEFNERNGYFILKPDTARFRQKIF